MKKNALKPLLTLFAILAMWGAFAVPAFAASNPLPNGWYMVVSGNSDNMVLDINNWNQSNGGNLEIYTKNNTTNQRFYLEYLNNGYYSLRALHSGKYLHQSGSGNNVHQWNGNSNANAQWALEWAGDGYYYLRNKNGKYMDNSKGRAQPGNNVCAYKYNGAQNQKWKFLSTSSAENERQTIPNGWYMIESGSSSERVLDINNWSMADGGNLEIYQKNGTTNQLFYLQYRNDGFYSIQALHSGKYLHKANSGFHDDVHQWGGYGAINTQWTFDPVGNGYYYVRNRSGNYLDNCGGSTALGNNVITYQFHGGSNQQWKFLSVPVPASRLTISDASKPGTITEGSGFTVKGIVSSNYVITQIKVGIYDAKGNAVSEKVVSPNYLSYDINWIDSDVHFGRAKAGTNYYKVWASDTANANKLLLNVKFTVKSKTDSQTQVAPSGAWAWPVAASKRTLGQRFGNHWDGAGATRGGRSYHCGLDISPKPLGTRPSIMAAANGKVKYAGYSKGNGYHVVIEHNLNGKTVYTLYSHMSSIKSSAKAGKTVKKGQVIGIMGTTGSSTGVHLHFGVFSGKYSSDPLGYTTKSGTKKVTYNGITYYNPETVIKTGKLP